MRQVMPHRATLLFAVCVAFAGPVAAQDTPQMSDSTADHSKFEVLKKDFKTGEEVTAACLSCHTEASDQVMHSIHWKWEFEQPETGQVLGKSHVINAFCGNVAGNEPRCTSCHVGYGWDDMNSPPPAEETKVDCLVCHDQSGQYTKLATGAGHPPTEAKGSTITGEKAWVPDLTKAALSVGNPDRENCGQCHFFGGGGDNVKHGDLSTALYDPSIHVDVHMSKDGANMVCSDCHVSYKHIFSGSRYDMKAADHPDNLPGMGHDVASCESCHGDKPHPINIKGIKLNDHTDKVACQTCHIPEFAKGGVATKTRWDWSTAGKMDEHGHPMHANDYTQGDGKELHTYLATKGDFEWGEDVVPYYAWFDGVVEYTTGDQTIDPNEVVEVNKIHGDPDAPDTRIWPFKRMEGRQAYDVGFNKLAYSHVWGPDTDTAFWTNYDWGKAIEAGMKAAGSEYSGEYGFVDTYMYWPITHMVSPASEAVDCAECHEEGGRLANIAGVYMPGTNSMSLVGMLGRLMIVAAFLGVMGHAALRILSGRKSDGEHHG